MTIEGDILKKLASIKKEINEFKEAELAKKETKELKGVDRIVSSTGDGRISYSSMKSDSAVIFLFDATGSMAHFWAETQKIMNEMVKRITSVGNVKLKCVAYRDYCDEDELFEKSGWYTEADPLIEFIRRIECRGGGDVPEAVEDALTLAYKEDKVTRVILVGDAPPHSVEEAEKQAKKLGEKGRPVFAFLVGNDSSAKHAFRTIAKSSNGTYGNLSNYRDLLDMMSITIVHDVGGSSEVEKYIKKYGTSDSVKEYGKSLPSYKK